MNADDLVSTLLSNTARTATSSVIRDLLRHAERDDVISLAGGIPAPSLFPLERIADAARDSLTTHGARAIQYGLTEGVPELCELLAARESIDADVDPSNLIVTTGSQQALDLLGRVLLDPGDVVMTDDPAYLGALQAIRGYNPRIVGVDVDTHGMDTGHLSDLIESGTKPVLVYTNPNFQNPTGATLSLERRRHLAELADTHGFLVIEDDPYGALRFAGEALPSMASMSDRVVRVRTVSKTLAPGLRVAWVVGPRTLIESVAIAKQAVDLHTSTLTQHVALELLSANDWYQNHERSLIPWYRDRRDALADGLRKTLGHQIAFAEPDGGMFLWAELMDPDIGDRNTTDLLTIALGNGVAFVPGSAFAVERQRPRHLRLSFATPSPAELADACGRLDRSIDTWLGRSA
ncbi:MAG: PLP-dependent aminotransferase family protein [Actinomycetia bacterium]|nr:PLP-dependent aminotransferase family protein [Actinomycetes bacterium]MCP4960782.1 PLP-dependent aminotransferase family protein [Actinomycetes bacterium]